MGVSRPTQTSRKVTSRTQPTGFPAALLHFIYKRAYLVPPAAASRLESMARGVGGTRTRVARPMGKAQGDPTTQATGAQRSEGSTHVDLSAATLAIRARLRQQALPYGALWRRLGEYAGGGRCDGCGERITSAQASYAVDFTPGVTPQSVRFHRVCFEIWQRECQVPLPA